MTKLIIILVIIILVGFAIYYGRFFVTKKVVQEEIPIEMSGKNETGTSGSTLNQEIRQGTFGEIDFIHKGKGVAKVLTDGGGKRFLRFEDFEVTNGPDLYVYLSPNPAPTKAKESLGKFISLGRLKGNVGNQNYEVPPDAGNFESVVIWCRQFSALFSYATLK